MGTAEGIMLLWRSMCR